MTNRSNVTSLASRAESRSAVPASWIDKLFSRFSAMYGGRFADLWRVCDISEVKAIWAEELAVLSREQLAAGVSACMARDWPPTLPEFLKLCRPPIDFESAYIEAVEQMRRREFGEDKWSSPAVYWAAVTIGTWDLRNATWGAIKGRWSRVFQEQVERGAWPEIPKKAEQLPAPGETAIDPEEAKRRIDAIRAMLAGKIVS